MKAEIADNREEKSHLTFLKKKATKLYLRNLGR